VRVAAALAALVLLAGCSSGDDGGQEAATAPTTTVAPTTTTEPGPAPSVGCDTANASPATGELTIQSGGQERQYLLTLPEDYDGMTPLPVVFSLHSLTVPHSVVPAAAGIPAMFEQYDFISVAPSGITVPAPFWIAVPIEPNRDVDFLVNLLDQVEADLCVDTGRIFSTGLSNGGQMSSVLACLLSDRITAVAPASGVEFSDLDICAGQPVPVMAFHGDADPIVPYEGGGLDGATIANQNEWAGDIPEGVPQHAGVDAAMANWAEHNGCDPEPVEERVSDEVIRRTWQGCEAETVLYVTEGGGHGLPGYPVPGFEDQFGHTTTDIDATALMFEFFLGPPG
jgi:polyhydroxybutyrate depolymerase